MEEVDKIILNSLKEINCELEEDVKLLRHLSSENIIAGFARCLNLINPSLNLSTQLPPSMSERFKLGASIANAIKELGYKDEIGYQTLLYSNEIEIRRRISTFQQDISNAVKLSLGGAKPCLHHRVPFLSVPLETGVSLPGVKRDVSPQDWCKYCSEQLPFLHEQTDYRHLLPSVITLNSRGILCPSQLGNKIKAFPANAQEDSTKSALLKQLEDLKLSNEIGKAVKSDIGASVNEKADQEKTEEEKIISQLEAEILELTSRKESYEEKLSQQYDNNLREDRVRLLLTQGDEGHRKLVQVAEEAGKKLVRLNEQWEQHRSTLMEQYQAAQSFIKSKSNVSNEQMEVVQETRNTLRSLQEQLKKKQAVQLKLEAEVANLIKNPKPLRSAYTQRIMEIISNIRKQTNEINKIIIDTKEMQRDVNSVTGRLERVFSVADDLIFQAAKKDEGAKRVYKSLVALHSDCQYLVNLVEETCSLMIESRDLEEQICTENTKNTISFDKPPLQGLGLLHSLASLNREKAVKVVAEQIDTPVKGMVDLHSS
ncbi:coiled-coil domain-containing protein 22 [Bemisia tabaci]|uniref:coiled-coil domain-containing protein 22 n=1 Tax=Bemisia tabaci TaxID=7038 RepID=UPI003B28812E